MLESAVKDKKKNNKYVETINGAKPINKPLIKEIRLGSFGETEPWGARMP